jgi:hypothetical protein
VKAQVIAKNIFKSPVKGTFLSATLTATFGAFLATALYVNDNYSNPITILSKYYLSIKGLAFGIIVPVFVGATTAGLITVSKRVNHLLAGRNTLKFLTLSMLVIFYFFITFVGALALLYLGN